MSLTNLHPNAQLTRARTDAQNAQMQVDRLAREVQSLQRRVDTLALTCQALWEVLCEQRPLINDEVFLKMEEIDRRDGETDGKISPQLMACPNCRRPSNTRRPTCLYCGAEMVSETLFAPG